VAAQQSLLFLYSPNSFREGQGLDAVAPPNEVLASNLSIFRMLSGTTSH